MGKAAMFPLILPFLLLFFLPAAASSSSYAPDNNDTGPEPDSSLPLPSFCLEHPRLALRADYDPVQPPVISPPNGESGVQTPVTADTLNYILDVVEIDDRKSMITVLIVSMRRWTDTRLEV